MRKRRGAQAWSTLRDARSRLGRSSRTRSSCARRAVGSACLCQGALVCPLLRVEHPLIESRLGIEGSIALEGEVRYDAEKYVLCAGDRAIAVFDKVRVLIAVERGEAKQRGTVRMALVAT